MAYVSIDYDEGEGVGSYRAVKVCFGDHEEKVFNSGDFVKDWWVAKKFMINELLDKEAWVGNSSSVDHFIMDGAPYDSAYLHVVDDRFVLKYVETNADIHTDICKGIEMFVAAGTRPSFEELKAMCEKA